MSSLSNLHTGSRIVVAVLLFPLLSAAQDISNPNQKGFVFSPGITYQSNFYLDVNLLYGITFNNSPTKIPIIYYQGFRLGAESSTIGVDNYTIAPKIGYEYCPMFFSLRLSGAVYFQNDNIQPRIIPELGLSLSTFINITYGYGFNLSHSNIQDLSHHRLTISVNFNRHLHQ